MIGQTSETELSKKTKAVSVSIQVHIKFVCSVFTLILCDRSVLYKNCYALNSKKCTYVTMDLKCVLSTFWWLDSP